MPSPLGKKIRALRQQKKLSLDMLAKITGSSKSYLWQLETKAAPNPSAEKIARIAAALEVTTEFLLADTATPDEEIADEAFFRKYKRMSKENKKRLRQILDALDEE